MLLVPPLVILVNTKLHPRQLMRRHSDTKLDEVKGSYQCAADISAIDGGMNIDPWLVQVPR